MQNRRQKLNETRLYKKRLVYRISKDIMARYRQDKNRKGKKILSYRYMIYVMENLETLLPNTKIWKEWRAKNKKKSKLKPVYLDEYQRLF